MPQGWLRSHFHVNDVNFVFRSGCRIADQWCACPAASNPKNIRSEPHLIQTEIIVRLLQPRSDICRYRKFRFNYRLRRLLPTEYVKEVLDFLERFPA